MILRTISAFLMLFAFSLFAQEGDKKTIGLATLEWPPYEGANLSRQGAHVVLIKEAFKSVGYEVNIGFFPWVRAIEMAKDSNDYIGYFTEYFSDDVLKNFYMSDPIGMAPVGLVERKDNPIKWEKFEDLKKYEIGVTDGYINGPDFDAMVAKKEIKTQIVSDDSYDVKKVFAGRIIAAVIDPNVFRYIVKTDPSLKNAEEQLQMNPKTLFIPKHYVCFRKTPEGLKLRDAFNEGLKKIDPAKIVEDYFKEMK